MKPMDRSILFIAYHFPPSAAVGGQRIANFAKSIRSYAWRPHVLTIDDAHVERIDPTRLKDVEDIPIQKAGVRGGMLALMEAVWTKVRLVTPQRRTGLAAPAGVRQSAAARDSAAGQPRSPLRRFVLSLLALPDFERGWCMPATVHAFRTIRRERIGWFMTSCPPYSVHVTGLAVKILTRRRWVADFRDPWMTTGSKRMYPTSRLSLAIERFLERRVVAHADLLVFNVERLRDAYRERYVWANPDKFVYIPNGITTRGARAGLAKYSHFTIAYTGSLYVGRSPEAVFQAVAQLLRRGQIPPDAIRIKLVGQCDVIDGVPTTAVVSRYGLGAVVEVEGAVPYSKSVEIIQRSHLALLLAPNLPYQIPAKVYDYLGTGTRILAIAEEGGTADLLAETGAGCVFRGDEVDAIADFLAGEYRGRATAASRPGALDRFAIDRITEELVNHLNRVATASPNAA
jgi:glycosyltransferase involved in cell wall biosynthesis